MAKAFEFMLDAGEPIRENPGTKASREVPEKLPSIFGYTLLHPCMYMESRPLARRDRVRLSR